MIHFYDFRQTRFFHRIKMDHYFAFENKMFIPECIFYSILIPQAKAPFFQVDHENILISKSYRAMIFNLLSLCRLQFLLIYPGKIKSLCSMVIHFCAEPIIWHSLKNEFFQPLNSFSCDY